MLICKVSETQGMPLVSFSTFVIESMIAQVLAHVKSKLYQQQIVQKALEVRPSCHLPCSILQLLPS